MTRRGIIRQSAALRLTALTMTKAVYGPVLCHGPLGPGKDGHPQRRQQIHRPLQLPTSLHCACSRWVAGGYGVSLFFLWLASQPSEAAETCPEEVTMKRGAVYWVNFDPALGGEVQKRRPVVTVCNDAAIRTLNCVQGVPLTSKTGKVLPAEALVQLVGVANKAMADQVRKVAKQRIGDHIGELSAGDVRTVEKALRNVPPASCRLCLRSSAA